MANNLIQIKRSLTTATPASLANGELAYTANGDILYIGSNGGIVPIGGKRTPGTLSANQALVANSTGYLDLIKTANLVVTAVYANGSYGTSGQVLVSNGTGTYWGTGTSGISGSDTQVQFNDAGVANATAGFTFTKTTNTLFVANTVTVGTATVNSTNYTGTANNTTYLGTVISSDYALKTYADDKAANAYSNATSYAGIIAGTAYSNAMSDTLSRNGSYTGNNSLGGTNTVISSNLTITGLNLYAYSSAVYANSITLNGDFTANGNVTLGNNFSDTVTVTSSVSSNLIPSANVTYHLGNNSLRWAQVHAQNVHSVTGYFDGTVEISGDLVVSGNLTTVNVNSIVVSDPMIYLAGNNYSSDLLDIGFAANYNDGTNRHTGLFRDASDGGLYKLFYNLTQELSGNNVVDVGDASYRIATLNAYLSSGGLSTNSTHVAITANSTVNVTVAANSLTLSTALAGTSGGTGLASYTAEDILVANSSNGFRKLALGTYGYVLQSNGSALVYDVLDGGSF